MLVGKRGEWRMGMSDGVWWLWENEFLGVIGMGRFGESFKDGFITEVL